MKELSYQLNEFLSGETLLKKMMVVPEYKDGLYRVQDRLVALMDIYKLFIPTLTNVDIYNRLYLSVLCSLEKKNTIEEVRQLNENFKNRKSTEDRRYGIIGGLDSFKILGSAGIGKSSAIQRCIDLISDNNLLVSEVPYKEVIPVLYVESVADGSFKNLLYSILKEVDNKLGTNYFNVNNRTTMNADTLLVLTSSILTNHVCVLVVDEIERVANDSRRGETLINYLTQLVNQSNISICFVGNISTNKYFSSKEYLSRRMIGIEMKKLDYDDHFYRFCELMFRYQYTKEKVQFDSSYATLFYKLTNGNTAMMKSLFIEAQKHSIITGIEKLSLDIIKDTFIKYFSTMVNHINVDDINKKKPIKEETIVKLDTNEDYEKEDLFEHVRNVSNKDINRALCYLKEKVAVEFCTYD